MPKKQSGGALFRSGARVGPDPLPFKIGGFVGALLLVAVDLASMRGDAPDLPETPSGAPGIYHSTAKYYRRTLPATSPRLHRACRNFEPHPRSPGYILELVSYERLVVEIGRMVPGPQPPTSEHAERPVVTRSSHRAEEAAGGLMAAGLPFW